MSPKRERRSAHQRRDPPKVVGVQLGKVIATRRLRGPAATVVTVQVGLPRKTRGLEEYSCPYYVRGVGDGLVRAAFGVDAVQALQLALRAVEATLARWPDMRLGRHGQAGKRRP